MLADVRGAAAAGLGAVLLRRKGSRIIEAGVSPDTAEVPFTEVARLEEVVGLV
jgi:FMN phosphatase YigB (HAD superfamily)